MESLGTQIYKKLMKIKIRFNKTNKAYVFQKIKMKITKNIKIIILILSKIILIRILMEGKNNKTKINNFSKINTKIKIKYMIKMNKIFMNLLINTS